MFFGGRRYVSLAEDATSQAGWVCVSWWRLTRRYGATWNAWAEALLSNLKDAADCLILRSSVLDYGATPIRAGDSVHVLLPVEGVDTDFRVLTVEYSVDGASQTLEATFELGREAPLLADYVYSLRAETDSLSRYKTARR
jgi:hypothetical protein